MRGPWLRGVVERPGGGREELGGVDGVRRVAGDAGRGDQLGVLLVEQVDEPLGDHHAALDGRELEQHGEAVVSQAGGDVGVAQRPVHRQAEHARVDARARGGRQRRGAGLGGLHEP